MLVLTQQAVAPFISSAWRLHERWRTTVFVFSRSCMCPSSYHYRLFVPSIWLLNFLLQNSAGLRTIRLIFTSDSSAETLDEVKAFVYKGILAMPKGPIELPSWKLILTIRTRQRLRKQRSCRRLSGRIFPACIPPSRHTPKYFWVSKVWKFAKSFLTAQLVAEEL